MPDPKLPAETNYLQYRLRSVSRPVLGVYLCTLLVQTLLAAWVTSLVGHNNFVLVPLLVFLGFLLFNIGLNSKRSSRWFDPVHFHPLLFFGFFVANVLAVLALINFFSLRAATVGYAASPKDVTQLLSRDYDFYFIKRAWLAYDYSTLYVVEEGKSTRYGIVELTPVVNGPTDMALRQGPVRCWLAEDVFFLEKSAHRNTPVDRVLPRRQAAINDSIFRLAPNATWEQKDSLLQYAMQPWLTQFRARTRRSPRWVSSLCMTGGRGVTKAWQDTAGVYRLQPTDNNVVQGTKTKLPAEELAEDGWGSLLGLMLGGGALLLVLTLMPLSKAS